jgi:hypothetical protein
MGASLANDGLLLTSRKQEGSLPYEDGGYVDRSDPGEGGMYADGWICDDIGRCAEY